jgi:hypothetical protein
MSEDTTEDDTADDDYVEECDPEFIDGQYYGCGACVPCIDAEDQRRQDAYEAGHILDEAY